MENLISMFCCNSKANSTHVTKGSSTWYPQPGQHISIRTFRQLKAAQMLRNTWRKTETSLIMEPSKSMEDRLEEVNSLQTTRMPRHSTVDPNHRPSIY
nr:symptom determinant protein [Horsegram yellow mosaic virus]UVN12668.1 symptom determination protein [Horsegram yellow mosaic virus]UVN12686.1 symptom determination protein [Horsegram yellow mosaic virus]WAJ60028.1 AC4 protein [Horsegram yellow mosaic virus]